MPDTLYGLTADQLSRLRKLLQWFENGRTEPIFPTKELPLAPPHLLATANADIANGDSGEFIKWNGPPKEETATEEDPYTATDWLHVGIKQDERAFLFRLKPNGKLYFLPASIGDGNGYELRLCSDEDVKLYVSNPLSAHVNSVVKVDGDCYSVVGKADDCHPLQCVVIQGYFPNCQACGKCYYLSRCDEVDDPIITNTNLYSYLGKSVLLDDGYCYEVSEAPSCEDAVPVVVVTSFVDCTNCGKCYQLENCLDSEDTLEIANDLAGDYGKTPTQLQTDGDTFVIYGKCWQVVDHTTCVSQPIVVEIEDHFDNCEDCGCVILVQCNTVDEPDVIVAHSATDEHAENVNLREYVDKYLRLDNGNCYSVSLTTDCGTAVAVVVLEAYDQCEQCVCYTLSSCDGTGTITTYADLSAYAIGRVLRRDDESCWTLEDAEAVFDDAEEFLVLSDHPSCAICNNEFNYLLSNNCSACESENSFDNIITTTDLHNRIGEWIKIDGVCFQISTTLDPPTQETISYKGGWTSCLECVQSVDDFQLTVLTGIAIEDGNIVATTEVLAIVGGQIASRCKGDDITIEGTECPTE